MKTLFCILILSLVAMAQISVQINVGPQPKQEVIVVPQGYVERNDCDKDVFVISPNVIGFYIRLNSGKYVLRCRDVFYNDRNGVVYYGPWREERNVVYRHDCRRYDDVYVNEHYKHKKHHGHGKHK